MQSNRHKAFKIRDYVGMAEDLMNEVDDFKYNHSLANGVGKKLADAINDLQRAAIAFKDAAAEQAFEDLEEAS